MDATDDGDNTALILAASEGRTSVVQALISAGEPLEFVCCFWVSLRC